MKEIYLKDQRLESILSSIIDKVYEQETLEEICKHYNKNLIKCKRIPELHGASDEYFRAALNWPLKQFAFPSCRNGVSTLIENPVDSKLFQNKVTPGVKKLRRHLGVQRNALIMMYPKEGFIGWHHNGNASGYNILFSYSLDGDGYFSWYDKEKDEIVKMQDKPGWNVKCGYYPDENKEPERVYWHTAYSNSPRLSIAYVIDNREMWKNMIEQITMGEYDENIIAGQGPLKHLQ